MTKPRIVLDTNVILSAILCGGNPAEYFSMASAGVIQLFTSPFILSELSEILRRKFKWAPVDIEKTVAWYKSLTIEVTPQQSVDIIKRKISDNRILECALEAKADLLVTGDKKDLLCLKQFQGIPIVSPIEGLSLLSS